VTCGCGSSGDGKADGMVDCSLCLTVAVCAPVARVVPHALSGKALGVALRCGEI